MATMTTKFKNVSDKNNFIFELTEPLKDLSPEDIDALTPWVGFNDKITTRVDYGKIRDNTGNCGITFTSPNYYDQAGTGFSGGSAKFNEVNNADGIYLRCLLLYYSTDMPDSAMNFMTNKMNATNYPNVRFVKNITCGYNTTMQKLFYTKTNIGVPTNIDETTFQTELTETHYYIRPVWLVVNEGNYYIFPARENNDTYSAFMSGARYLDGQWQGYNDYGKVELFSNTDICLFGTYVPLDSETKRVHTYTTDSGGTITVGYGNYYVEDKINNIPLTDNVKFNVNFSISYAGSAYSNITYSPTASSADLNKYYQSAFGFKFVYGGTTYRPIVKNGIVVGFTDDPTVKSEYDEWEDIDHKVPGGSGGGGSDEDDIDDIGLTLSTASNAAFRKMFALNSTELNQLEAALSGNYLEPLPSGFDPLQSVISLSVFPWDITNLNWIGCNTRADSEIVISGWQSGVTGSYVTGQTSAFIEVGSFKVETHHNNFLDYAPYTTISVYVPYCGEIDIPTNLAMGQTITVYLIYDIPSGSCEAVIKSSNGAILGTIAGDFSSEIEITSSEAGLKKQAIISSGLNVVGQVANTAMGIVKDGPSAATGGLAGSLGAVSQSIASMNKNYTASIGTTDGIINFFKPDQCYVKITRPSVSLPANYGHTTGYACNKTAKFDDLIDGNFYVVNNPDLSNSLGNAEEKTLLKTALENGFFK